MIKKCKYFILTIILILFLFNLDIVISSTKDASIIFFNKVFVSVFPFIILSDILIYYDYHLFLKKIFGKLFSKIFNIDSNTSIIFILSLLSSSPNNAIFIKDMLDNNEIDLKTANKIINYTFFPSISFVIGVIGLNIFKSLKIGFILWLFVLLINILIGLYLRKEKNINLVTNKISKDKNIFIVLKKSILKGINTSFIILGNLIFFMIINNIVLKYININSVIFSIISSMLELTNGINIISNLNSSFNIKLILSLFSLSFSGFSIIFQAISILSDYKINIKRILVLRLIFSIITVIIFYLILITCSTIITLITITTITTRI